MDSNPTSCMLGLDLQLNRAIYCNCAAGSDALMCLSATSLTMP